MDEVELSLYFFASAEERDEDSHTGNECGGVGTCFLIKLLSSSFGLVKIY